MCKSVWMEPAVVVPRAGKLPPWHIIKSVDFHSTALNELMVYSAWLLPFLLLVCVVLCLEILTTFLRKVSCYC